MKKRWKIIFCILALILLIPIPSKIKDGGTIRYNAILYTVYDMHRVYVPDYLNVDESTPSEYIEGIIVKIVGITVFNNTNPRING